MSSYRSSIAALPTTFSRNRSAEVRCGQTLPKNEVYMKEASVHLGTTSLTMKTTVNIWVKSWTLLSCYRNLSCHTFSATVELISPYILIQCLWKRIAPRDAPVHLTIFTGKVNPPSTLYCFWHPTVKTLTWRGLREGKFCLTCVFSFQDLPCRTVCIPLGGIMSSFSHIPQAIASFLTYLKGRECSRKPLIVASGLS